jgi:hypothetical protein
MAIRNAGYNFEDEDDDEDEDDLRAEPRANLSRSPPVTRG